jgi:hypothetical protein
MSIHCKWFPDPDHGYVSVHLFKTTTATCHRQSLKLPDVFCVTLNPCNIQYEPLVSAHTTILALHNQCQFLIKLNQLCTSYLHDIFPSDPSKCYHSIPFCLPSGQFLICLIYFQINYHSLLYGWCGYMKEECAFTSFEVVQDWLIVGNK